MFTGPHKHLDRLLCECRALWDVRPLAFPTIHPIHYLWIPFNLERELRIQITSTTCLVSIHVDYIVEYY